jgi:hypothetical protein
MGRKADFNVAALNKRTDAKSNVGVAWKNDDGTVSITLNAFVVIEGGKDMLITLFPSKDKPDV